VRGRLSCVERQVDHSRYDHPGQAGRERQRQSPPGTQLAHIELAPGLQPGNQEENVISPEVSAVSQQSVV
jgi:hypothetical protein